MRILEIGLGVLWLVIAGGSTVLIIADAIRQKRGRNTTPPTSQTEVVFLGQTKGRMEGMNVLPQNVKRRYDQPHSMPLPHWYSK